MSATHLLDTGWIIRHLPAPDARAGEVDVASPVVLWQLWRFITPGLHSREKKYAIPFVLSSVLLFIFLADATISVWRRGDRRRAALLGGSMLGCVVAAAGHTFLIHAGIVRCGNLIRNPVSVSGPVCSG